MTCVFIFLHSLSCLSFCACSWLSINFLSLLKMVCCSLWYPLEYIDPYWNRWLRMYIYGRGLCEVGECSPISLAEKRRRVFLIMDIILNWFHTTSVRNDLAGVWAGGWMRTNGGSEIQLNICTWNWIHKTQWEVWWGTLELDQLDDGAALTWTKSLL